MGNPTAGFPAGFWNRQKDSPHTLHAFEETVMEKEQLAQIIAAYGTDILRFCRITAGSSAEGDELYQEQ